MIELNMRSKTDENCPDDLLRSVTNCVEQTLRFSYNHHHLHQLNQKDKLRILFNSAKINLQKLPDYLLDFWMTEFGVNRYFMLASLLSSLTGSGPRSK